MNQLQLKIQMLLYFIIKKKKTFFQIKMIPKFIINGMVKINTMHPPSPSNWLETEVYIKELEKTQIELLNFEKISTTIYGESNKIQPIVNSLKLLLHYEKKEGLKALKNKLQKDQKTPVSLNQTCLWYSYILLSTCQDNLMKHCW